MKRKQFKKRIICCILAVLMLLGALPLQVFSAGAEAPLRIMYNGEEASEILLVEDQKLTLTTQTTVNGELSYQWEILADAQSELWVKINGKTGDSCDVSYALVANLLSEAGKAQLRCVATDGETVYESAPVTVTISYNVNRDKLSAAAPMRASAGAATRMMASSPSVQSTENRTHSVVIHYLFAKNNTEAQPSATSTFAVGEPADVTVTSPVIAGYYPVQYVDGQPIAANTVTVYEESITSDIEIYVYYLPTTVKYTVHHHLQNLDDDGYSTSPDKVTEHYGYTDELVGECAQTYLDDVLFTGFKALDYERTTIAADGTTVIEIYYDREYYLVSFDLAGGFGVEPIYTRYGSLIKVDIPTYPGHIFSHWLLVGFAGSEPTEEQKNLYHIVDNTTEIEVHASMQYQAFWEESTTQYTLIFWLENAADDAYTYGGYLRVAATSGDRVSAADRIGDVAAISDKSMFTYNPARSDHNVLVKGDGSTIVNVYYTRKSYTLTFRAPGYCTLEVGHTHSVENGCYAYICGKEEHIHDESCVGNYICGQEEHLAHTPECLSCKLAIHSAHTDACLICSLEVHTHTKACYDSTGLVGHEGNWYYLIGAPSDPQQGEIYIYRRGASNIRRFIYLDGKWYGYQDATLTESANGKVIPCPLGKPEHTHSETRGCYRDVIHTAHTEHCYYDVLHTHSALCCEYAKDQHTHVNDPKADDSCLRLECTKSAGHTHGTACSNASSKSVIKRVTAKYQAPINHIWPITTDAPTVDGVSTTPTVYNGGERWQPDTTNSAGYKDVLVFMAYMPGSDITFDVSEGTSNDTFTMHYMLEVIPGQTLPDGAKTEVRTDNNKTYYEWAKISAKYNHLTYEEDFFAIKGYTRNISKPAFSSYNSNGQLDINGGGDVYMYYNLNTGSSLILTFDNKGETMAYSGAENGIVYGYPLTNYQYAKENGAFTSSPFVPDYPSAVLEEDAFEFSGWYTSYDCVPGTEVDWDTLTMPDGPLTLYAGWTPVKHTVRVYKEKPTDASVLPYHIFENVSHAHYVTLPEDKSVVAKEGYEFMGWFYTDPDTGKEKAFHFNHVSVRDSIDIYARWRSIQSVHYTIHYMLKQEDSNGYLVETDIKVADSLTGRTNAGLSKTFLAKSGLELYDEYRGMYYPEVQSHTVQIGSSSEENQYIFWYVYQTEVTYTVKHVPDASVQDAPAMPADEVITGNYVVVTEFAAQIEGYLPDATRKMLILTADPAQNVITFVYSKNTENEAYYTVVYHVERLDEPGAYNTLANFYEEKATVGSSLSFAPRVMTGFTLDTSDNNTDSVKISGGDKATYRVVGDRISPDATLPKGGLVIDLYYTRNQVEYEVLFYKYGTSELIGDHSYMGTGRYGETLTVSYKDLEAYGYTLVGDQKTRTLELDDDLTLNTVVFTYQEKQSAYSYNVIIYDGVHSFYSENVAAQTGTAQGSGDVKAIYGEEHRFLGWYRDAAMTQPVVTPNENGTFTVASDVSFDEDTWELTPAKNANGVYPGGTYYAKVEMLRSTLTIKVEGDATLDPDQRFIFWISGVDGTHTEYVDQVVDLQVNESVTLTNVPVGNYQIKEASFWSWRYELDSDAAFSVITVSPDPNASHTVTYKHETKNPYWCDGDGYTQIIFD